MPDVGFTDANTLSLGPYYYPSKATCPTHGEVGGDFRVYVTAEPAYNSGRICPKCFVDWVRANVTAVTPLPISAATPADTSNG